MTLIENKDDWKTIRLDKVLTKKEENDRENARSRFDTFVKVEHMEAERLHLLSAGSQKNEELPPTFYKVFRKGQVLFPTRNPHLQRTALAHCDGICGEKTLTLEVNEEVADPNLIPFLFHSVSFYDHTAGAIIGSTNPHCRWRDVANYEFLLPPKKLQSTLSDLLWKADEVLEKRLEIKKSVQLLRRSLARSKFGTNYEAQASLTEVANIIMGQSPPGSSYNEEGNGIRFLQGNAEFGRVFPTATKFTDSPKKIAPKGSVLISVRAPVGAINHADQDYCVGRGLAGVYSEDKNVTQFLGHFLSYAKPQLERMGTGSTFKAVNKDALGSLRVSLPQASDLVELLKDFTAVDEAESTAIKSVAASKRVLQSLINQIF